MSKPKLSVVSTKALTQFPSNEMILAALPAWLRKGEANSLTLGGDY
jgi:hypothetical protein